MKVISLLILSALFMGAGPPGGGLSEKEEIRKTLHFPEGEASDRVVVDNISGSIAVAGYDGKDVELVVQRTSHGTTVEKLKECREKIGLDVREEPGTIILYVRTPWRCGDGSVSYRLREDYGYDADFDFELRVPFRTGVLLKTVNRGTITVSNLNGAFEVDNVNGRIDMGGIGGSGQASTVNGNVEVRFSRNPDSSCGFRTVNGSIRIEVPEELSADLRFKTFNGEVFSDFDVTGLPSPVPAPERIGRRTVYRGNEFSSVRAGRGGPELVFETLNGDIRILRNHN